MIAAMIYRDSLSTRKSLDGTAEWDSAGDMIRGGFLSVTARRTLIRLARDGLAEHRVARPADRITDSFRMSHRADFRVIA